MRGVIDIYNKWWNVLGKRKSGGGLPYTFIKSTPDATWFDIGSGSSYATFSVYLNGSHYQDKTLGEHLTMHYLLGGFAEGTTITITDELAPGTIKYLKVGNTVIFDNR